MIIQQTTAAPGGVTGMTESNCSLIQHEECTAQPLWEFTLVMNKTLVQQESSAAVEQGPREHLEVLGGFVAHLT